MGDENKGSSTEPKLCSVCRFRNPVVDGMWCEKVKHTPQFENIFCIIFKPSEDSATGYHSTKITKGVLGESSKIIEEYEEFLDAVSNNNPVMALCELSDLIGAIEAYAKKHNITLEQLIEMKEATARAFASGNRK